MYWVTLDPTLGSEISKTRPCVVITNDIGNEYSARVIVAAVSSSGLDRIYPFEVLVEPGDGGLAERSKILLDQVRAVDKVRLRGRIGTLSPDVMHAVDRALCLSLSL